MDEIMDIIYYFMPITRENMIIEQGLKNTDSIVKLMTNFFQPR